MDLAFGYLVDELANEANRPIFPNADKTSVLDNIYIVTLSFRL